jgi:hypothetical protein
LISTLTSLLVGRHSTIWTTPSALFVLVNFEIGSHFMLLASWTTVLPFVLLHITGLTGAGHHAQPFTEMGVLRSFLPGLVSNHHPSNLHLPAN